MSELTDQQADSGDWQHLKPYGYAPGNYMSRCLDCGQRPGMDKRASRCRPCAEAAYSKDTATPAQQAKPPKHRFWGAGEADCPADIKARNGELHSMRCKVCGETNPRDQFCWKATKAEANPLTDEQIVTVLHGEAERINGGPLEAMALDAGMLSEVIKIWRLAERAHGIAAPAAQEKQP